MPILTVDRETKEVELPKTKGKVVLYQELLTGDVRTLDQNNPNNSGFELMVKMVKDWDFTDSNGVKLPVTKENIDLLPIRDAEFLANSVKELADLSTLGDKLKKN